MVITCNKAESLPYFRFLLHFRDSYIHIFSVSSSLTGLRCLSEKNKKSWIFHLFYMLSLVQCSSSWLVYIIFISLTKIEKKFEVAKNCNFSIYQNGALFLGINEITNESNIFLVSLIYRFLGI